MRYIESGRLRSGRDRGRIIAALAALSPHDCEGVGAETWQLNSAKLELNGSLFVGDNELSA
jgi:hypothetical protein